MKPARSLWGAAVCVTLMASCMYAQQSVSSRQLTVDKHFFDESASSCSGNNVLFYNEVTGEGLVGSLNPSGFQINKTFGAGSFQRGWTYAANVDSVDSILFYKASTGEAALGTLAQDDFHT